jgi:hypothetical protein
MTTFRDIKCNALIDYHAVRFGILNFSVNGLRQDGMSKGDRREKFKTYKLKKN